MHDDNDLNRLARRLARRDVAHARIRRLVWVTGLGLGVAFAWVAAGRLLWPALPLVPGLAGIALALAAGWLWAWFRTHSNPEALLLRADRECAAEAQLVTAYELQTRQPKHPFLPALLDRSEKLAARVDLRRIVPFFLSRGDAAAGIFALAAFVAMLVPPTWVGPILADETAGAQAMVAAGARLEDWADYVEETAREQELTGVGEFAGKLREVSRKMQEEGADPRNAIEELENLARQAHALAKEADDSGERPQQPGNKASQTAGTEERNEPFQNAEEAAGKSAPEYEKRMVKGRGEEDRLADSTESVRDHEMQEEMEQPVEESEDSRTMEDRENSLRRLMEKSERKLEDTVYNLSESFFSPQADRHANPERSAMMDPKGDINPDTAVTGGDMVEPEKDAPKGHGGMEAAGTLDEGGGPADNAPKLGDNVPEQTAFQDTEIEGAMAQDEADRIWVRQLPKLAARETVADGVLPQFERTRVAAQGGMAIPRAYRALVKSYFIELSQLTQGEN